MNTKLALGTAQFGLSYGIANKLGKIPLDHASLILDCAVKHGISVLDTAVAYGDSEQRLGKIGVKQWQIVSKLPGLPDSCENVNGWVFDQLHASLNRLGVGKIYGLLLHKPRQLLEDKGDLIYNALKQLKNEGVVSKIGISIYDPDDLDLICKFFDFDLIQVPFNILDRRIVDSGWLAKLSNSGVEVHARSCFLQGLLLMPKKDVYIKFDRWSMVWNEWFDWLERSDLSALEACLRFVLSYKEISKVVIGVDNVTQLVQIVKASQGSIPPIPEELNVDDKNLIDPTFWNKVT